MNAITFLTFLSFATVAFCLDDPRCTGVPEGQNYLFSYPGDCTKFIECTVAGEAVAQSCAGGLWFNEAIQNCDNPDSSGCIPITCPPGVVDFYPYPSDCTRYIECYRGTPTVYECTNSMYYSTGAKRCVSAEQSGCGEYSTSVEPTWTTPAITACYGVLPGYVVLRPYPGDCNRYIQCTGADATVQNCPSDLYFNNERQLCDHPDVSGCDPSTGSPDPSTTPNSATVNSYDDPRCADGNTEYWPDVECSRYVQCYGGNGYLMDCPAGLYFDESDKLCEDPSISDCGTGGRVTATPDPNTSTNPTVDPDCPWPTSEKYLFPYPGDCSKYMECDIGVKVVRDCPPDLWFNPTLLVCDYPYAAGCQYAKVLEEFLGL